MTLNRCGHFSLEIEIIPISTSTVKMRVPIRRCAFAERMVAIISQTEEGRLIADKLTLSDNSSGASNEKKEESHIRAAFGPDLEAIHAADCTQERCLESCTPSFHAMLKHFNLETIAEETKDGCMGFSRGNPIDG